MINRNWFNNAINKIRDEEERQKLIEIYQPLIISAGSIYPQKIGEDKFYESGSHYTDREYTDLDREYGSLVDIFGLACAIGKKEAWIQAGLFNEEAYIYWIDGKFMAQANNLGVLTQSSGVVFHYGDSSHKGKLVEEGKYQDTGKFREGRLVL